MYLATKAEEQPRDLRDIITVGYSCIHREGEPPLRVGSLYRELRESVIACELLVLRGVGFDLGGAAVHPHRHLLHFATLLEQQYEDRNRGVGVGVGGSSSSSIRETGAGVGAGSVESATTTKEDKESNLPPSAEDAALRVAVNTGWSLCNDAYNTRLPLVTSPAHLGVAASILRFTVHTACCLRHGGGAHVMHKQHACTSTAPLGRHSNLTTLPSGQ
jgi:hypothetical protein